MGAAVVGAAVVDAAVVGAAVVGAAVVDAAVVDAAVVGAAVVGATARGALMSMKHSNGANGSSRHGRCKHLTAPGPRGLPTLGPLLPARKKGAGA